MLRKLQFDGQVVAQLSGREREVIKSIALGKSSKEIGRVMDISPHTLDTYRKQLMDKLDLHNLAEVVRYAVLVELVS